MLLHSYEINEYGRSWLVTVPPADLSLGSLPEKGGSNATLQVVIMVLGRVDHLNSDSSSKKPKICHCRTTMLEHIQRQSLWLYN